MSKSKDASADYSRYSNTLLGSRTLRFPFGSRDFVRVTDMESLGSYVKTCWRDCEDTLLGHKHFDTTVLCIQLKKLLSKPDSDKIIVTATSGPKGIESLL